MLDPELRPRVCIPDNAPSALRDFKQSGNESSCPVVRAGTLTKFQLALAQGSIGIRSYRFGRKSHVPPPGQATLGKNVRAHRLLVTMTIVAPTSPPMTKSMFDGTQPRLLEMSAPDAIVWRKLGYAGVWFYTKGH